MKDKQYITGIVTGYQLQEAREQLRELTNYGDCPEDWYINEEFCDLLRVKANSDTKFRLTLEEIDE
ncbi:MAG TPA: hypothetical protein VKR58_06065 [Aquella sp.]|nr:hypothetical protein [Aquella sp.]